MQEFFFLFIDQSDSHRFCAHLNAALIAKIAELCDVGSMGGGGGGIGVGGAADLARSYSARVLKLKVCVFFWGPGFRCFHSRFFHEFQFYRHCAVMQLN